MKFTVLGHRGFIGSHLVDRLQQRGIECLTPGRELDSLPRGSLGHVIYAIGLTADFRHRLHDTVRAHVSLVNDLLERCEFDSFLYLSSTRIYGMGDTAEDSPVLVQPANPDHVYNLSKLAGESICLADRREGVRVARLSNVYGSRDLSENFLTSLIRDALGGTVEFRTAPWSEKDYVSVDDAIGLLIDIAIRGKQRLYNVASGANVSSRALADALHRHTGARVSFIDEAAGMKLPGINTERIRQEFGFCAQNLLENLPSLIESYQ